MVSVFTLCRRIDMCKILGLKPSLLVIIQLARVVLLQSIFVDLHDAIFQHPDKTFISSYLTLLVDWLCNIINPSGYQVVPDFANG